MSRKNKRSDFVKISKSITLVLQLGLNMIVATGVALAIGYWLDKWLSTNYLMIIFIFLGFGAGMRNDYILLKKFYADDPNSNKKYKNGIMGSTPVDKEEITNEEEWPEDESRRNT